MKRLVKGAILIIALLGGFALRRATGPDRSRLPELDLPMPSGDRLLTSAASGKVALVNIWASWCGPCREELPALDSLAATFDTAQVVFLALSDDEDPVAARQFLFEFALPSLDIALGLGRLQGSFGYTGLPYTVIVDRDGRIVRRWTGYGGPPHIASVAAEIRELLGTVNNVERGDR